MPVSSSSSPSRRASCTQQSLSLSPPSIPPRILRWLAALDSFARRFHAAGWLPASSRTIPRRRRCRSSALSSTTAAAPPPRTCLAGGEPSGEFCPVWCGLVEWPWICRGDVICSGFSSTSRSLFYPRVPNSYPRSGSYSGESQGSPSKGSNFFRLQNPLTDARNFVVGGAHAVSPFLEYSSYFFSNLSLFTPIALLIDAVAGGKNFVWSWDVRVLIFFVLVIISFHIAFFFFGGGGVSSPDYRAVWWFCKLMNWQWCNKKGCFFFYVFPLSLLEMIRSMNRKEESCNLAC